MVFKIIITKNTPTFLPQIPQIFIFPYTYPVCGHPSIFPSSIFLSSPYKPITKSPN